MGKYTDEKKIENLVQMEISDSTRPSSQQVNLWIKEVEQEIDSKKLGWDDNANPGDGYSASNVYLSVPKIRIGLRPLTRFKMLCKGIDPEQLKKGVVIPIQENQYYPIIPGKSVTLYRRTSSLTDTPEWKELTRGYYAGWDESADSDFMVLTIKGRAGQEHGVAFFIYSSVPLKTGPAALKASYSYGWNLPQEILNRYATLKVGMRVLEAAVESGEPARLGSFVGGDFQTFVNTQISETLRRWKEEIIEIEKKFFPKPARAKILWI